MGHVAYHSECRRKKTEGIYHMFWHSFVGNASYVFANVLSTQDRMELIGIVNCVPFGAQN